MAQLVSNQLEVDSDLEAVQQFYLERGWSDGLPIIPPTPQRVAAMLGGFGPHVTLYLLGWWRHGGFEPIRLWDFDPIIPSLALSVVCGVVGTYCAPPTSSKVIDPLFYQES